MSKTVVVVGAGISGLVCAKRLSQVGTNVILIDASDRIGGRVKTDIVDGFHLDHGFQVLLTAYRFFKLEVNLDALDLRNFEPGCLVWDGKKQREVHKDAIVQMLVDRWISMGDMAKTATMALDLRKVGADGIWELEDQSIEDYLRMRGFSENYLDRFVRPFFGGVLGDSSLTGSCLPFLYYWSMFEQGDVSVPSLGMGEIPRQIEEEFGNSVQVRLGQRVTKVLRKDGYVQGVGLESGEEVLADSVVIATDARGILELAGQPAEQEYRSFTTVYFAADKSPIFDPIIVTNGSGIGRVNHVAPMSKISPSLAPAGQHLISATLISGSGESDLNLAKSVQYELKDWFPDADVSSWRPLAVYRIPNGQLAQPVGFMELRPDSNPEPGLFLAGESVTFAGLDGAVKSGQEAASHVLDWFREPAAV